NSFAHGYNISTDGVEGAFVIGKFGGPAAGSIATVKNQEYGFYVANGTSTNARSLSAKILNNGQAYASNWNAGGADYGEMFETYDGKKIEPGYFVTFEDGKKIRKANANDKYILGIISETAGIIANNNDLNWKNRYLKDEWGKTIYDEAGNMILNPEYDNSKFYISRMEREEWAVVGLLGQLLVRDDGTCKVNGYCKVGEEGIATHSDIGYRIIERVDNNKIVILFIPFTDYFKIEKLSDEYYNLKYENEIMKEEIKDIKNKINN
ncbi:MAG: peptidase G2 autoproteolytic cleavage domain-containing protein, partial [Paraclostridium sp.]